MTRNTTTPKSTTPSRITALLALFAIFAVITVITFGARHVLGRNLDTQPTQAELASARADAIAAIPQLPKDTEEKLSSALYPQLTPVTATFADPLVDRAGLDPKSHAVSMRSASISAPSLPLAPTIPDKLARLTQWQQNVRSANAGNLIPPSITTAYLISEVSPTGRITTKGSLAAWLYIDSEKRQIPANLGAKFYDGVLTSIDAQGVVFRTSSGQTKMVQWDRQEEFTGSTPTPPTVRGNEPQPSAQPQPQARPVSANTPGSTTKINTEYADLQVAVRNRYNNPATVKQSTNQPTNSSQAISAAAPVTEALPADNLTISTPKATAITPEPNAFQPSSLRANKLNYAHAPFNYSIRKTSASATTFRSPKRIFDLDNPTSFGRQDVGLTNQLPDETASPVTSQTSEASEPTAVAVALPTSSPEQSSITTEEQTQERSTVAVATTPNKQPTAAPEATPAPAAVEPQRKTLCDASYRGEIITITNESNRPLSLLTLVNRLNEAYNANIVLDYDVQETPVRLTISNAPWTSILRTLLDLNDLDMVCLDGGIVQIAKRSKISAMGDLRRRSAPIVREVFQLRYLQQTAGGRANLAGQTQSSNGATLQSLEDAIRDILKAGGDPRGEARRVPGRNQLLVAATREQMADIRDLIARVDRPGYQVKISALVYTANENRLREIGSQLSIAFGNVSGTNLGTGTTLPNTSTTSGSGNGSGSGSGSEPVSGINPGGIPGLPTGMRPPTNGLGASNPLATFGVTSLFGTAQFAYQLTLAQNKGIVNIQSRPFGIVSDGDTFDLVAGTQIPVVTTTIAGGAPFQSGQVQFIEASRIARITPQVAEDEKGNPNFVTLNIQLENNSVDTSLGTFNGVPGVNRQSLQTVLRLHNGETVVIGGLAADQVANSTSKVPGLGDVPLLGNLFKKRSNQESRDRLYFAITVEVIPLDAPLPNFQAPADAITAQPPPPRVQKPSPYAKP